MPVDRHSMFVCFVVANAELIAHISESLHVFLNNITQWFIIDICK